MKERDQRFYGSMEEELQRFEREEFGTNDMEKIREVIIQREMEDRQAALTGMEEEQADWEETDPEIYSHDDAFGNASQYE